MELLTHNPSRGVYAATSDYAHALEVRGASRTLFVSGTMGLREDGTAPATLDGQLERIWENLRAILASAGMGVENIVRVTSYLRDAAFAAPNAAARNTALGGRLVPTTAIVATTLADDWLVELEVIALA
jgi:enamine deaminase RidA (YjgF/YER057c/UK114 family)